MAIWIGERPNNIAWNDFKASFITQYDRYPTFTDKKEALRRMQRTHNQTYQQFYDKFKNRLKTMVPNGEITAEVRQQYFDEFATIVVTLIALLLANPNVPHQKKKR